MSSDASTLPLRDAPAESPPVKRRFLRGRARSLTRAGEREWLGAVCLAVIVLLQPARRARRREPAEHPLGDVARELLPALDDGPLGGLCRG